MNKLQALQVFSIISLAVIATSVFVLVSESSDADSESIIDEGLTYTLVESGEGNYATVSAVDNSLTTIVVKSTINHSGMDYEVRSIDQSVFKDNKTLVEITICANERFVLSKGQFTGCSALSKAVFEGSLTEITDNTFVGCSSLKEIVLPNTVITVGNSCFEGCSSLTSINLGAVQTISDSAFKGCKGLTALDLESSVRISSNAFSGCTGLTSVALPNVQSIGESAFGNCSNLNNIEFGSNLTHIGMRALAGTSIKDLVFPASITSIDLGESNSQSCFPSTMTSLTIDGKNPKYACESNMLIDKDANTIVYAFNIVGELTVSKNVGPGAFYSQGITELIISEGVTSIGNSAFVNNVAMVAVSLPSSLVEIGSSAFNGCSNLTTINASTGLRVIGGFSTCTKLDTVTLPETVEEICDNAFNGCSNLTTINLPNGLKVIGSNAFNGCSKLSLTSLPASLTEIGDSAFNNVSFGNSSFVLGESHDIKLGATGIITTGTITLNRVICDNEYVYVKMVSPSVLLLGEDFNLFGTKDGWIISNDGKTLYGRDLNDLHTSLVIPSTVERIVGTGFQNRADAEKTHFTISCEDLTKTIQLDSGNDNGRGVFANLMWVDRIELPNIIVTEDGTFYGCHAKTISIASMNAVPANTFNNKYLTEITVGGYTSINGPITSQTSRNLALQIISFPDTLTEANIGSALGLSLYDASKTMIKFSEGVNPYSGSYCASLIAGKTFLKEKPNAKNFYEVPENEIILVTEKTTGNTYQKIAKADRYDGIAGSGQVYRIAEGKVLLTLHVDDELIYVAVDKGSVSNLENPTKIGYNFEGWFTDPEYSTSFDTSSAINADQVLYAKFTIVQYTITFDTAGGSEIAAITLDYGSDVTAPADPTRTGYTFTGWDAEVPAKMPVDGMTLKASWKINQYTITFDTAGGSEIAAITQDYDSDVTAPDAPTRTGYTFTGWDAEVPAKMPASSMTLKASWKINQYTITFDTAGGSAIAAITQDYNTSVTAPSAEPSKDGYRFVKWDSEIPASMPANDVIIKAVWAIVATVNENGKSIVTLDSETSSFIPAAETKEITVEIRENTAVKVENASDLIGKTVVSKVEPVSNSTGVSGTAYEFTFTADGTQYNGKIQVTLPYTKEAGKEPVVYYWNGSESTKMNVVSSTDTSVTFETDHNSMYVVASETPSKDDGLNFLLFFGLLMVVGIAVSMLVGFNFYRKKA